MNSLNNMKRYFKQISISFFLAFVLFLPFVRVHAAEAVKCADDKPHGIVTCCEGSSCDFNEFILAIQKFLGKAVEFALAFSVVIIAIAGWKYLTSGGNAGERDKANKMFVSVGWGIAFVLGAWLIVNLIMTTLVGGNITNFLK